MKKILSTILGLFIVVASFAQLNPVKWSFNSKKIADKQYEVSLTATIENGWHLYSQTQPASAVNMPTAISFTKNPLVTLEGKAKEEGKLEFFEDKKLKIAANQFTNKVVFVQKLKLKANVKTTISGSVEYQTCDDKKCLPPKTQTFSIALK